MRRRTRAEATYVAAVAWRLGAPIAHAGMHIAAVVHSYDGDTFLPPHR